MNCSQQASQLPAEGRPSAAQWALFERRHRRGGVYLLYLLRAASTDASEQAKQTLGQAATAVGGQLRWSGRVCTPLNPLPFPWQDALLLHFRDASACRRFIMASAQAGGSSVPVEVEVHSLHMHAGSRLLVALLQWLMPWFVPAATCSDRDIADECVSSVDADAARLRELQTDHSMQPVCILNFHRYRQHSHYSASEPEHGEQASGLRAYMRYGRAALRTVLGRGNRLLLLGRYGQCLIGQGGDPAASRFDEVTLMQYHSRRELLSSFRLKAMEGRLRHRRAGLAHAVMVIMAPDINAPARSPKAPAGEPHEPH